MIQLWQSLLSLLILLKFGFLLSQKHQIHNVSSTEFLAIANETYAKVLSCVQDQWMYTEKKIKVNFAFPADAEQHFLELKNATEIFRQTKVHNYAGYAGPWLENVFINKFLHKPLHHYRGFIPLFLQWIDTEILQRMDEMYNVLLPLLRPNVLYLAISQGDAGLGKIGMKHPNILVLSAGGFGHIPLPLVKGEIPYSDPPADVSYKHDLGFYGTNRPERRDILNRVQMAGRNNHLSFTISMGKSWVRDMQETKFNLAPRGYGRTSFRFAEAIQIGRIPIFLFNDHAWIPYAGSNISIDTYGYAAKTEHIPQLIRQVSKLTKEELAVKLEKVAEVRKYFTYPGVMEQIDRFLLDPFGKKGGDLRCQSHPKTFFCCG